MGVLCYFISCALAREIDVLIALVELFSKIVWSKFSEKCFWFPRRFVKWLVREINILLKAFKIKSVLSVHAQTGFKFVCCLVIQSREIITYVWRIMLDSLKTLHNSKDYFRSRIFVPAFLRYHRFSLVYNICYSRLSEQFPRSHSAFGAIFSVIGGFLNAVTSSLKKFL